MSHALDPSLLNLNDCGCCEGLGAQTPVEVVNLPGLSAIAYRVGTHSRFKASMLASLSSFDKLALGNLKTRDDDDFSVALLDAWATAADVLTFYQERIANESYLRTATERFSLLQLARLIGYELRPGVAASTYLAFTIENAPGAPGQATIANGTRVQSIPDPGELPQTFETVEQIEARAEWNALKPRLTQPLQLTTDQMYMSSVTLQGVATTLKSGDMVLIVTATPDKSQYYAMLRRVQDITPNRSTQTTVIDFTDEYIAYAVQAWQTGVFALRTHASLFSYNAPDWDSMPDSVRGNYKTAYNNATGQNWTADDWPFPLPGIPSPSPNQFDLDAVYSQIIPGNWMVLTRPGAFSRFSSDLAKGEKAQFADGRAALAHARALPFRGGKLGLLASRLIPFSGGGGGGTPSAITQVASAGDTGAAGYTLSARVTQITPIADLSAFFPVLNMADLRQIAIYVQSEQLTLAEQPLTSSVYGSTIELSQPVQGLVQGQMLIVSGNWLQAQVAADAGTLYLYSDQDTRIIPLNPGDLLQVIDLPYPTVWHLVDKNGVSGYVYVPIGSNSIVLKDDETTSEAVSVKSISPDGMTITLASALQHTYDRTTVTIYGNVALATHGETVQEDVLGSGDASQPYQSFTLHQSPLTYTSAPTASGAASTLQVRVNDIEWHEVPSLYGYGPRDRVFVTSTSNDGKTTVEFGDGVTGARPPTGQENVRATFRKGIGVGALVKAGQLSLLMTRPLGVKSVINPQAATGAADPEAVDDARHNAPLTVLTLDRIVSLQDYEDFARAFAGIAKALATWTWIGLARAAFVTVAGPNGAEVSSDSDLYTNLVAAMQKAGDPYIPIRILSYRQALFRLAAKVKVDPDYRTNVVLAAVERALRSHFSFDARAFGQPVMLSELIAVMQTVPGVVAVDVYSFYRSDDTSTLGGLPPPSLPSAGPQAGVGTDANLLAAELLTLDPGPLDDLGVMS